MKKIILSVMFTITTLLANNTNYNLTISNN